MPITRKLLAQDENDVNQLLKIDNLNRFIVNDSPEWQFLFGPGSEFTNSSQILKLAAQFDTSTLDDIRIIGYLYNPTTGAIDNSSGVTFNIYKVEDITTPKWNDNLLITLSGVLQTNNYYFVDVNLSALLGTNLDGDTTLMIEAVGTRLMQTYRDRIYINHLGVYNSVVQLRNEVEFLDLTKLDE